MVSGQIDNSLVQKDLKDFVDCYVFRRNLFLKAIKN